MNIILMSFLSFFNLQKPYLDSINKKFDEKIIAKISNYEYSNRGINNEEFLDIRNKANSYYNTKKQYAYNLLNFIKYNHESTVGLNYYNDLNDSQKLIFLGYLIRGNGFFFVNNKNFFLSELDKMALKSSQKDLDTINLLKIIAKSNNVNSKALIEYHSNRNSFDYLLLQNHIINHINDPNTFELFIFLAEIEMKKNPFKYNLDSYFFSQNPEPEIKRKYADYFFKLLKQQGFDNEIYISGCLSWISEEQIKELCVSKKQEITRQKEILPDFFRYLGYYQLKYFPIEESIRLIENLSFNEQIFRFSTLINLREDLTYSQKKNLFNVILKNRNAIIQEVTVLHLIDIFKSIYSKIDFKDIIKLFPKIELGDSSDEFYKSICENKIVKIKEVIEVANNLKTFPSPLVYKKGGITLEDKFIEETSINSPFMLMNILHQNNLYIDFNTCTDWIGTNYKCIIDEAIKNINTEHKLNFEVNIERIWKNDNEVIHKVFLKVKDRLHTIIIDNDRTDIKAIYLLLNKAFIDLGINERIVYLNDIAYFVDPKKVKVFIEKIGYKYEFSDFE